MADDVQALTARLAADPTSLAFLALAEELRCRGQLAAARAIASGGVARHPHLADGYDVMGRILADQGEGDLAFDAWTTALRLSPEHIGAHKGLAYLAFRSNDLARVLRHLELAAQHDPSDEALVRAVERTRAQVAGGSPSAASPTGTPLGAGGPGTLLVDKQGRRLAGAILHPDGSEVSDTIAAQLAAVAREIARTARLLQLGVWSNLEVEGPDATWSLVAPTQDTILLAADQPGTPPGRLAMTAERAARQAGQWLESLGT